MAIALPIPRLPPVMTATLSSKFVHAISDLLTPVREHYSKNKSLLLPMLL
jgi:hypothetical protein